MGVVYNSNQVKYGDRGYLDAKMQPVANLAALSNDITEVFEGMTVVVLNDGSGQPHDYWRVNGAWVRKDSGSAAVEELSQEVSVVSGQVESIQASVSELSAAVSGKVDQETGKGLSSNDFTNELKSKLEGVEADAQKNVKANWNESDENSDAFIQNKPDLSGFVSSDQLNNYYTKSEVYTKEEIRSELDDAIDAAADYTDEVTSGFTAQIAASLEEAKAYVDGKDYVDSEELEEAIAAEAARALSAETEMGSRIVELETKVEESGSEQEEIVESVNAEEARALSAETELAAGIEAVEGDVEELNNKLSGFENQEGAVKDYIDTIVANAVTSLYKVKGSVESYAQLPHEDVSEGDVYNVESETVVDEKKYPAGTNWVWVLDESEPEGGYWDPLGGSVDMSAVDDERARAEAAEAALSDRLDSVEDGVAEVVSGLSAETEARVAMQEQLESEILDVDAKVEASVSALTESIDSAKEEVLAEAREYVEEQDFVDVEEINSKIAEESSARTEAIEAAKEEAVNEAKSYVDEQDFAKTNEVESALVDVAAQTELAISSAVTQMSEYADSVAAGKQDAFEVGDGLVLEDNTLKVSVDGSTIVVNNSGKLHVIGGGGSTPVYTAGQYISIENDEISVTGITPENYTTTEDVADAVAGAVSAMTEFIGEQDYAKKSEVNELVDEAVSEASDNFVKSEELEAAVESAVSGATEGMATTFEVEAAKQEAINSLTAWTVDQHYTDQSDVENYVAEAVSAATENLATKSELNDAINDARVGAIVAATAWTVNQEYAKEEDVIDTVSDLLVRIDAAKAEAISASTEYTDEVVATATSVAEERERAEAEEAAIRLALNNEIDRSTNADASLRSDLNGEIERASSAETILRTDLDAEVERAEGIEAGLRSDLEAEIERASNAESSFQDSIDAERARAILVEDDIDARLDDEIARALSAETLLSESMNGFSTLVSEEESRAMGVESEIYSALTQVRDSVSVESERAISAETELAQKISELSGNTGVSEEWVNAQGFLKSDSLENYATKDDVADALTAATEGVATEEWVNEQGFLTQHQSLDDYATKDEVADALTAVTEGVATEEWVNEQGFLTQHQSLDDYATKNQLSAATNDMATQTWVGQQGFLTQHQSLDDYATKDEVADALTAVTSDMATQTWVGQQGFLTEHQSLDDYATKDEVDDALTAATAGLATESYVDNALTSVTATSVLSQAITSTTTVGGVSAGTVFSAGTSIEAIIRQILVTGVVPPTPSNAAYFYYGSVPEEPYAFYEAETITPSAVTTYLTRSQEEASAGTFTFNVTDGDTAILVVVPDTLSLVSIVDGQGHNEMTSFDIVQQLTINNVNYTAYCYYFEGGLFINGRKLTITTQNA